MALNPAFPSSETYFFCQKSCEWLGIKCPLNYSCTFYFEIPMGGSPTRGKKQKQTKKKGFLLHLHWWPDKFQANGTHLTTTIFLENQEWVDIDKRISNFSVLSTSPVNEPKGTAEKDPHLPPFALKIRFSSELECQKMVNWLHVSPSTPLSWYLQSDFLTGLQTLHLVQPVPSLVSCPSL